MKIRSSKACFVLALVMLWVQLASSLLMASGAAAMSPVDAAESSTFQLVICTPFGMQTVTFDRATGEPLSQGMADGQMGAEALQCPFCMPPVTLDGQISSQGQLAEILRPSLRHGYLSHTAFSVKNVRVQALLAPRAPPLRSLV